MRDVDKKAGIKVITNRRAESEKVISLLKGMGLTLESSHGFMPIRLDDGKVQVRAESEFDEIVARGIAKIGFNYMAKVCGSGFALKDDFNAVRRFIRYGESPPGELKEMIEPNVKPILATDTQTHRQQGHILALEWDITRSHVLARVSLFNSISWTIRLARNFSGLYRDIKSAHFYDIRKLVVKPLRAISRELVP